MEKPCVLPPEPPTTTTSDENAHPNCQSLVSQPASAQVMDYVFQKNKIPVDILPSLTLSPFCSSTKSSESDTEPSSNRSNDNLKKSTTHDNEYELEGIVHHIGRSPSSGHYTADALRPRLVDDDEEEDQSKLVENQGKAGTKNVLAKTSEASDAKTAVKAGGGGVISMTGGDGSGETAMHTAEDRAEGKDSLEWTSFDDGNSGRTTLTKIQASRFKQQTAYMLLYQLKETEGIGVDVDS